MLYKQISLARKVVASFLSLPELSLADETRILDDPGEMLWEVGPNDLSASRYWERGCCTT